MIDLIIQMGDNGHWKDGVIVDYIENPTELYSNHMETNFMIKRVPDSWLPRIKQATSTIGEPGDVLFMPRVGKFNFKVLKDKKKDDPEYMDKQRDKTKRMDLIDASELGIEEITLEIL